MKADVISGYHGVLITNIPRLANLEPEGVEELL